jgi:hypothetical protein
MLLHGSNWRSNLCTTNIFSKVILFTWYCYSYWKLCHLKSKHSHTHKNYTHSNPDHLTAVMPQHKQQLYEVHSSFLWIIACLFLWTVHVLCLLCPIKVSYTTELLLIISFEYFDRTVHQQTSQNIQC